MTWLARYQRNAAPGQPIYVLLYASAIIFFCFFYNGPGVNPRKPRRT